MTALARMGGPYINAQHSDGSTVVAVDANGDCTLLANQLYYFPINMADALAFAIGCRWDSVIVITSLRFEDQVSPDALVTSATAGDFVPEDPATAYVPISGGTVTNMTVAVAGGAAGGCVFNLSGVGTPRGRIRVQVGATGGKLRVGTHGKA